MIYCKSLAPWVLLLVQESYLLYINLYYRNLVYKICTTILKNHMQATLDAIIGENQSAAIKNRMMLHTFSTIRDVIDVSYNLNSNLAWTPFSWTFYEVCWDFMPFVSLFCHKFVICKLILPFGYGDKFVHQIHVAYN